MVINGFGFRCRCEGFVGGGISMLSFNDFIGVVFVEEVRGGKSMEFCLGVFEVLVGGVFDVIVSVWDGFF